MNKSPGSGRKKGYGPLYETDPETGKIKPLPLPEWVRSSATKLSDKKSSGKKSRRKMIDLQPLVLTEVDFEERGPRKKRKLDLGGSESKILSKPTRTSIRNSFGSTLRRSNNQNSARALNLRKFSNAVQLTKGCLQQDKSPLLNLEDVEDELIKTNSALKIPKKFNFSKEVPKTIVTTPSRMSVIHEESGSPDTFTENELKCMTSPSLLNNINVQNNKIDLKSIGEVLEKVVKKEEDAFANYCKVHQENMAQLKLLLSMCGGQTGKENGHKFVTTPNSTKENLRKKVLKKNLHTEVHPSPRTRNALSMYNSLRSTNPVLETPKFERRVREDSPGQFLSDALMKQCLLLQTPIHKK